MPVLNPEGETRVEQHFMSLSTKLPPHNFFACVCVCVCVCVRVREREREREEKRCMCVIHEMGRVSE